MRFKELKKGSGKYFQYAVGEVILIVMGVLIAVSIDNWNDKRINEQKLQEAVIVLEKDFKDDQKNLKLIQTHYTERRAIFDSIINQKYTLELMTSCNRCHFLISGHLLFRPNTEGFESLKRIVKEEDFNNDSLLLFIQKYSSLVDRLNLIENNIIDDVNGNLKQWRDRYEWFTPFFKGQNNQAYHKYQTNSPEYRNKVAYHYALIYDNYLIMLDEFINLQNDFMTTQ